VSPEIVVLDIPNRPDRVVVVIRVDESSDAPHEVHVSSTSEIPVRRGTPRAVPALTTLSA
jgi:hypothetical protein